MAANGKVQQCWQSVDLIEKRLMAQCPDTKIRNEKRALDQLSARMRAAEIRFMERRVSGLDGLEKRLLALNPENVMKRGFAFVRREDQVVTSAADLSTGDHIYIRFNDGETSAHVD